MLCVLTMTTISFIHVIVAMNTISLRPPLWNHQASQQTKVFPVKKTYHCRNISITISNSTTMVVGTSGKILLLWTNWFGINFVESLGNSRPMTCGPNKNKCFLTGDKNLYSNSSAVVFHIPEGDILKSIIATYKLINIISLQIECSCRW